MEIDRKQTGNGRLVISNKMASIRILRNSKDHERWFMSWTIQWPDPGPRVNGELIFTTEDVRAAFGLVNFCRMSGRHLIRIYGGQVAAQGLYIRTHEYLNIPGPGTGHDGDPNVSVQITPEIGAAVEKLTRRHRA